MQGSADLSPCGTWRFRLTRDWGDGPRLAAVLLNPSTADATCDDPTLRRLIVRARALGCGGLAVANLFALRSADPAALDRAADPVGPGNDAAILAVAAGAAVILCGWGNRGGGRQSGGRQSGGKQGGGNRGGARGAAVAAALRGAGHRLWHLGLTQTGAPRHPLYVAASVPLRPWSAGDQADVAGGQVLAADHLHHRQAIGADQG